MKNLLKFVFLIVITAALVPSAFAWDDVGHKLTAYIAWERLNPAAREKISRILQSAPEDSDLSVFYPPDSRSPAAREREHFMLAAYWADIVRDRKFPVRQKKYHQSNWHYFDNFWSMENGRLNIFEKFNEDGGKAVPKLFEFEKVLNDPAVSDADKAIAIAWVMHLTGDIHQPLHCSARVTPEEPKGDQGGNLFLLTPKDTPRENQDNLHSFWDGIVKRSIKRKNDEPDAVYIADIGKKIMKKHPFEKMRDRLRLGKFDDWHKEGLQIATGQVFPFSLKRFEAPSEDYKKMALKISEEQIALAGYRMGEMFNRIFGGEGRGSVAARDEEPCRIIRKINYPVTKTNPSGQPLEIALLDLCPADRGMVARPMYPLMKDGKMLMREYDVTRIFKTAKEAREYAEKNGIKDVSIN